MSWLVCLTSLHRSSLILELCKHCKDSYRHLIAQIEFFFRFFGFCFKFYLKRNLKRSLSQWLKIWIRIINHTRFSLRLLKWKTDASFSPLLWFNEVVLVGKKYSLSLKFANRENKEPTASLANHSCIICFLFEAFVVFVTNKRYTQLEYHSFWRKTSIRLRQLNRTHRRLWDFDFESETFHIVQ